MAFKVCSSCGKQVREIDPRCWNCKSMEFQPTLTDGTPVRSVQTSSASGSAPPAGGVRNRPRAAAYGCLAVVVVGSAALIGLVVLVAVFGERPSPSSTTPIQDTVSTSAAATLMRRDCGGFVDAVKADPTLPEWIQNWTGKRNRREFCEDIGVNYCKNASVFGRDEALVILATDLRVAPRVNGLRVSGLSPIARKTADHFGGIAEHHICPDWNTTEFALGEFDRKRSPLRCGEEIPAR